MAWKATITYVGGPKQVAREFRKTAKESLAKVPLLWHAKFLPRHFESNAYARYKLPQRTKAYRRRKIKKLGADLPLVSPDPRTSGQLKRMALVGLRVSSTSKGAKGFIKGPYYLAMNKPNKGGRGIDKAQDLTTVTSDEAKEMAKYLDELMTAKLNAINDKETVEV